MARSDAEWQLVQIQSELPRCSREAADLLELKVNAERVGVVVDPRTSERISRLQSLLSAWQNALEEDEAAVEEVTSSSKIRMLKASVEAIQREFSKAA